MRYPSSSQIACAALNLAPAGQPKGLFDADDHHVCAMCARHLADDDLVVALHLGDFPPSSFTDIPSLVSRQGLICGYCVASCKQEVMRELQRAVITPKGIYSIATDDARAWFLLTPPEPPFVVVLQTRSPTSTFHLHWRTPVTIDKALLHVRVDDRLLQIRTDRLYKAVADCQVVADAMQVLRPTAKKRDVLHHPFTFLDRALTDSAHGNLHRDAVALMDDAATNKNIIDALNRLQQLSTGELWALATLAKAKSPTPTKPPRVTVVGQLKVPKDASSLTSA